MRLIETVTLVLVLLASSVHARGLQQKNQKPGKGYHKPHQRSMHQCTSNSQPLRKPHVSQMLLVASSATYALKSVHGTHDTGT